MPGQEASAGLALWHPDACQRARALSFAVRPALAACGSRTTDDPAVQEERARVLPFADAAVECDTRTGFFGGRYASFNVTATVTNDIDNPINASNLPAIKWTGDKAEPDVSNDKLLSGESCDVTHEGEIDADDGVPAFEFSGKVDFHELEDARRGSTRA